MTLQKTKTVCGYVFMDLISYSYLLLNKKHKEKLIANGVTIYIDGRFTFKLLKHTHLRFLQGPDFFLNKMLNNPEGLYVGPSKEDFIQFKTILKDSLQNTFVKRYELPYVPNIEKYPIHNLVDLIEKSKVKNVYLAIGMPKQEILLTKILEQQLNCDVDIYCIGAAFNFFINKEKRAPKIIRLLYLEWLYRVMQYPKKQFIKLRIVAKALPAIIKNYVKKENPFNS